VSAASYFPWRRYNKLRFFNVVVTVGWSVKIVLYHPPCAS
jgi:hypothetical protein